jgi:hypothetical protein
MSKRKGHKKGLSEGLRKLDPDRHWTGLFLGWEPSPEDEKLFGMLQCLYGMHEPGFVEDIVQADKGRKATKRDERTCHAIWEGCISDLGQWCEIKLIDGDASFFERLAAILRRIENRGALPIDWEVWYYKSMMEPREYPAWVKTKKDRARSERLRTYNVSESLKKKLPAWPPSAKELHEFVNAEFKCSERAVRDAAERVGVPLRPDPKGRGRRKKLE